MRKAAIPLLVSLATVYACTHRMAAICPDSASSREACLRATLDSASGAQARTIGRILEALPDSSRAQFLEARSRSADSLYAQCRRRAAGPLTPTANPLYNECVIAGERSDTDSLDGAYPPSRTGAVSTSCVGYEPDTVSITGSLERRTYPGRPNYESVQQGDEPETGFYLRLANALCISRHLDEVNEPVAGVTLVQLVLDEAEYDDLRRTIGKRVALRGTLFHSHTGHHHAPVLLKAIR
ncbi:MAG: DUF4431 domain-containing protein [Acidobacteria bacterium]|nr:DUF4431 domain-containing protein [Acidobacteriota bacterium]